MNGGQTKQKLSDNGSEYISHELRDWLKKQSIEHQFIEPGKPQQNAYIERYNRMIRYDLLNRYLFSSIEEVQNQATNWLWMYNNERPHKTNSFYPPCEVRK